MTSPGKLPGILLLLAVGCASPHSISQKIMSHATHLFSIGDAEVALEEARGAVGGDPSDIEIHWLYQDLLLASGRRGAAIDEYFERLRRRPGDPNLRLLYARLGLPGQEKKQNLRRLLTLKKQEPWVRLALTEACLERGDFGGAERWIREGSPTSRAAMPILLLNAISAGDTREAMRLADEILSDDDLRPPPSAALIYAYLLHGEVRQAVGVGRRLHAGDDRAETFRARGMALLRGGLYVDAVTGFHAAERRGGWVEPSILFLAYHGAIQTLLKEGRPKRAAPIIDQALERFPQSGRIMGLKAIVQDRLGDQAGVRTMRRALEFSPTSSDLARRARLFFVKKGLHVEAYEAWIGGIPPGADVSPDNRLSERFRDVVRLGKEAKRFPGEPRVAAALAEAYARAGWISEAISQYGRALSRGARESDVRPGLGEVRGFRRVILRMQTFLRSIDDRGMGIEDVADALARIVGEETGRRPSTDGLVESFLFFGKEANPLVRPESPLLAYFLRFNHYLDLREIDERVECRLMELVRWSDMEEQIFEAPYRWQRITTDRAPARHPSDGTHWVAGTASWSGKGVTVDLETIRSTLFPSDGPIPPERDRKEAAADGATLGIRFSQELRDDLLRGALERAGSIRELLGREEENVAQHELGHVVDFAGLVPWGSHIFRHMGILLSHFFSPASIASRYQIVAETFAIARSRDPKLAIITSIDWLRAQADRPQHLFLLYGEEPGARGIYLRTSLEIIGGILEKIAAHPESYPAVDPEKPILDQIHRLDDAHLRGIAWQLYDEAGGRR